MCLKQFRKEQGKVSSSAQSCVISLVGLTGARGALMHIQTQFPAGKSLPQPEMGLFSALSCWGRDNWEGLILTFLSQMPLVTPASPSTASSTEQLQEWEWFRSNKQHPKAIPAGLGAPQGLSWEWDRHSFTAKGGKDLGTFLNYSFFKKILQRQWLKASKFHPFLTPVNATFWASFLDWQLEASSVLRA